MICLIQAPGYCMTENSIEHFLWNPSEFTSNVVFENLCCLWIVFINSTFQVPPTENSQSSWDHTVARGYRFEVKCIYPLGSTAWGTQEFCSCNELAPHLAGIPQCSYQCLFFFSVLGLFWSLKTCSAWELWSVDGWRFMVHVRWMMAWFAEAYGRGFRPSRRPSHSVSLVWTCRRVRQAQHFAHNFAPARSPATPNLAPLAAGHAPAGNAPGAQLLCHARPQRRFLGEARTPHVGGVHAGGWEQV